MTSVVLVGIGGYGGNYVSEMLEKADAADVKLAACVDPFASRSEHFEELKKRGVAFYDNLEEFYKHTTADLAVISSPIHYHAPQTLAALAGGSYVLCEKPIAATLDDAHMMAEAARKAGRFVAIGYQISFSPACLSLKKDILAGRYGKPLRFRTITCWPRWESYYNRNNWAGRITTDSGVPVFDSPVNNATAHYLHNMLFLAGDAMNRSASPVKIEAELYRAKQYENYDTAAMRIVTDNGVEVIFLTTHSCSKQIGPIFELEFEKGKVTHSTQDDIIKGHIDGKIVEYGKPNEDHMQKLWVCISAAASGSQVPCEIQTALPHMICVNKLQELPIRDVPKELIAVAEKQNDRLTYIRDIEDVFMSCFEEGVLPAESGKFNFSAQESVFFSPV